MESGTRDDAYQEDIIQGAAGTLYAGMFHVYKKTLRIF